MAERSGGSLEGAMAQARAYLFATRINLVYGFGDCYTSTSFGLAPRRFVETALFRLRGLSANAVSPPLPDPLVSSPGPSFNLTAAETGPTNGQVTGEDLFVPLSATLEAVASPYSPLINQFLKKVDAGMTKHRAQEESKEHEYLAECTAKGEKLCVGKLISEMGGKVELVCCGS